MIKVGNITFNKNFSLATDILKRLPVNQLLGVDPRGIPRAARRRVRQSPGIGMQPVSWLRDRLP
jgi:hypothetical protein